MKQILLINYNDNTDLIEEEEQNKFIRDLLEKMQLPIQNIWNQEILSIKNKIDLRNLLVTYNIKILNYQDGSMDIFLDQEIIAKFKKPIYVLRKDNSKIDKKNQFYLEMYLDIWSVFEETKEM